MQGTIATKFYAHFFELDAGFHGLVVHHSWHRALRFRRLDFHKNELPDGNFFLPLALVFRDTQANKQYYLFCNLTSKDLDFRNAGAGGFVMYQFPRCRRACAIRVILATVHGFPGRN